MIVGEAFVQLKPDAKGFAGAAEKGVLGPLSGVAKKAAGIIGGAFAAREIFQFGKDAFAAATESLKVGRQTEAVIRSTGGAANVTAGQIDKLANTLSRKAGVDDEVIARGANLLLTFTNVRNEAGRGNDIFDQANRILLDMATAMGTEAPAAAIQLGKALNDPIAGITALTRVGVTFTEQQKDQIKELAESGRTVDAQRIILAELNKEFGGSAEAQATAFDRFQVVMGNLQERVGTFLLPIVERASVFLGEFLPKAFDAGGRAAGRVRDALEPIITTLLDAVGGTDLLRDAMARLASVTSATASLIITVLNTAITEHTGLVFALAGVYAASLLPQVLHTARAFTVLNIGRVTGAIDLAITSVRVLALEMGRLGLAARGLALGAGFAAIALLAQAFFDAKREARELVEEVTKPFDTDTLGGVTGAARALAEQLEATHESGRRFDGVMGRLSRLAHAPTFLENKFALQGLGDELENVAGRAVHMRENAQAVANQLGLTTEEVERLAQRSKIDLAGGFSDTTKALIKAYDGLRVSSPAAAELGSAVEGMTDKVADSTTRLDEFKRALDAALGIELNTDEALSNTEAAFDALTKSVETNGRSLDLRDEKGRNNAATIRDLIRAASDEAVVRAEQGESYEAIAKRLDDNRIRLEKEMGQLGFTKAEIAKYRDEFAKIPAVVQTVITADTKPALDALAPLRAVLGDLAKFFLPTVTVSPVPRRQHGGRTMAGQVYLTGEGGPELFAADTPGQIFTADATARLLNGLGALVGAAAGGGGAPLVGSMTVVAPAPTQAGTEVVRELRAAGFREGRG